jgi:hypothetical protein
MKFSFALLVFFIIMPGLLTAQVMTIEHRDEEGVSQGDIVEGVLEVGGDLPLISPEELIGKDIGRTFHIFRAKQEGPLYRLGLAVTPWAGPGDSLDLNWKNTKVQIEVRDLKFKSVAGSFKDEIVIEETPWDDGKVSWALFAGIFISLMLFSSALYVMIRSLSRLLAERRNKMRIMALREKWRQVFLTIRSREDFETIYRRRKKWLRLVDESESVKVFLETMKRHQYKPDWTEPIELEVRQSFESIQNIFGSQG